MESVSLYVGPVNLAGAVMRTGRLGRQPLLIHLLEVLRTRNHRVIPAIVIFVRIKVVFVYCLLSSGHIPVRSEILAHLSLPIELCFIILCILLLDHPCFFIDLLLRGQLPRKQVSILGSLVLPGSIVVVLCFCYLALQLLVVIFARVVLLLLDVVSGRVHSVSLYLFVLSFFLKLVECLLDFRKDHVLVELLAPLILELVLTLDVLSLVRIAPANVSRGRGGRFNLIVAFILLALSSLHRQVLVVCGQNLLLSIPLLPAIVFVVLGSFSLSLEHLLLLPELLFSVVTLLHFVLLDLIMSGVLQMLGILFLPFEGHLVFHGSLVKNLFHELLLHFTVPLVVVLLPFSLLDRLVESLHVVALVLHFLNFAFLELALVNLMSVLFNGTPLVDVAVDRGRVVALIVVLVVFDALALFDEGLLHSIGQLEGVHDGVAASMC